MARPRLGEQERRARTVGVRVTAAEEAELRLGAALSTAIPITRTCRPPAGLICSPFVVHCQ